MERTDRNKEIVEAMDLKGCIKKFTITMPHKSYVVDVISFLIDKNYFADMETDSPESYEAEIRKELQGEDMVKERVLDGYEWDDIECHSTEFDVDQFFDPSSHFYKNEDMTISNFIAN